jgi:hypothetical protein
MFHNIHFWRRMIKKRVKGHPLLPHFIYKFAVTQILTSSWLNRIPSINNWWIMRCQLDIETEHKKCFPHKISVSYQHPLSMTKCEVWRHSSPNLMWAPAVRLMVSQRERCLSGSFFDVLSPLACDKNCIWPATDKMQQLKAEIQACKPYKRQEAQLSVEIVLSDCCE